MGQLLLIIFYIYGIISQIMTIYFWWEFFQETTWWIGLLLGGFVGEFKGLLWPFFI